MAQAVRARQPTVCAWPPAGHREQAARVWQVPGCRQTIDTGAAAKAAVSPIKQECRQRDYAWACVKVGLTVLAALGGRTDHDLGNLGLLARLAMGERLVFETADQTVLAVDGETSLASLPGETWSFWTFDPSVQVTVEGVRWPIQDSTIDAAGRPSISNEALDEHIRVRTTGGSVVVVRRSIHSARR